MKMKIHDIASRIMETRDYALLDLWSPKLLLTLGGLFPVGKKISPKQYVIFSTMFFSNIFALLGNLLFVLNNRDDFTITIRGLQLLLVPSVFGMKLPFLFFNFENIGKLLNEMKYKFWPCSIVEEADISFVLKSFKTASNIAIIFFFDALLFCIIFMLNAALSEERVVPFPAHFPFNWTASPFFEILWFFEMYSLLTAFIINVGLDLLTMALLLTIANQYCILSASFKALNTEGMNDVYEKLNSIHKNQLKREYSKEKLFLVYCVRHHQMLLKFMQKFNKIYNIMEIFNIMFAVWATCLGYFQLTKVPDASLVSKFVSCLFLLGLLLQLFIDCFLGTVLYHQASLLPEAIFKSNWLEFSNVQLKKDIVFVLLHSQRIPQFNAYNLYDMNMISFGRVLKVAFSLYTVLSAIDRK